MQNASAGNYLVIAWKDKNDNGNLDENVDEVGYYLDSKSEPALVTSPASNIDIRVGGANPLAAQPSSNPLTF